MYGNKTALLTTPQNASLADQVKRAEARTAERCRDVETQWEKRMHECALELQAVTKAEAELDVWSDACDALGARPAARVRFLQLMAPRMLGAHLGSLRGKRLPCILHTRTRTLSCVCAVLQL